MELSSTGVQGAPTFATHAKPAALQPNGNPHLAELALKLYLAIADNARSHDPLSPEGDADAEYADQVTMLTSLLAEEAVAFRCLAPRDVAAKLILAVLESDTGTAASIEADVSTRLAASAAADLIRLSAADDLGRLLDERGLI